jgi:hypothetical protein
MKNLIIFVFSVLFAISCKQEQFKEATVGQYNQYGNPNVQPDSTDGWGVDTALVSQNYVADTSYTSIPSATESGTQIAKLIDENAYKASLLNDKLVDEMELTKKAIAKLQKIRQLANYESNELVKRYNINHEQETILAHESN